MITDRIGLHSVLLPLLTEYCIKVTGYTKVGESPEGNCFFVKTSDSGKLNKQCITQMHHFELSDLLFKTSPNTKLSYENEFNVLEMNMYSQGIRFFFFFHDLHDTFCIRPM